MSQRFDAALSPLQGKQFPVANGDLVGSVTIDEDGAWWARCRCESCDGREPPMTMTEFQAHAGQQAVKDWRKSTRVWVAEQRRVSSWLVSGREVQIPLGTEDV